MFITFEGPDGSGKTFQIALLADTLTSLGYPVLATREPGGTTIGEQVRYILHNLENTSMHPYTEILLYQASRAQLVKEVILPHLHENGIVLCDRFADSTLAYQGYGHQIDLERLRALVDFATDRLKPDLTLLLDLDVERGLQRRASDGEWNRLDAYDLEFHRRVRKGYLHMASLEPQRWVLIDAAQAREQVKTEIEKVVLGRLKVKPQ